MTRLSSTLNVQGFSRHNVVSWNCVVLLALLSSCKNVVRSSASSCFDRPSKRHSYPEREGDGSW